MHYGIIIQNEWMFDLKERLMGSPEPFSFNL